MPLNLASSAERPLPIGLKKYYELPWRYAIFVMLPSAMIALPIKMVLRWLFNLKYIIAMLRDFLQHLRWRSRTAGPRSRDGGADPEAERRLAHVDRPALVFSLMVWADYDREWKKYQKKFTDLETAVTRKQIQEADSKVDATRRAELEQKVAQGKQEMDAHRSEVKKAEGDVARIEGEWYRVDQDYRFTKAEIDVAKYDYEEDATTRQGRGQEEGEARRPGEEVAGPAPEARGRGAPARRGQGSGGGPGEDVPGGG